ncbi:response regulator [Bowmanella denitrificans]|uniref:response regulator n=1 Tax=Bowmanella denitrificans TaxID=366582 RepID=UPI000C9AD920|nr:response regulator [Bowmanella denitrificans]
MRILLIEQQARLRKDLTLVLQSTGGFDVMDFATPEQAVVAMIARPFDVLLGGQQVLATMPASITKIGYGAAPDTLPEHCLGWVANWQPLPGFAEQVRRLLQKL